MSKAKEVYDSVTANMQSDNAAMDRAMKAGDGPAMREAGKQLQDSVTNWLDTIQEIRDGKYGEYDEDFLPKMKEGNPVGHINDETQGAAAAAANKMKGKNPTGDGLADAAEDVEQAAGKLAEAEVEAGNSAEAGDIAEAVMVKIADWAEDVQEAAEELEEAAEDAQQQAATEGDVKLAEAAQEAGATAAEAKATAGAAEKDAEQTAKDAGDIPPDAPPDITHPFYKPIKELMNNGG